eukprot:CAMPEP_0181217114 /NCGR_PEP_ID=MMETSP1096-20121128/26965_1 /TAXON_ID=156174 ORGANISM="Chrysochromulina ericina, Strain CCMP281" /NCGR_SAMPLE_ID=MMETSP1096 /ASSEMBLY_ACC=CAM_ASM_000453 /LENGTH=66 /DNA_ID=CAMNT_0023309197 /DNA_START=483 /DNA_END=683 /DNA_ORIENTATION=-
MMHAPRWCSSENVLIRSTMRSTVAVAARAQMPRMDRTTVKSSLRNSEADGVACPGRSFNNGRVLKI